MAETAVAETSAADDAALLQDPFILELIKQLRAQDTHGTWEGKTDAKLLEPYIITAAQRKEMPMMGDPDPETLWRLDLFHNAIGLCIERSTGCMVSPMMKISHEGFGRAVLTTGRLIVVNRYLRDIHRFGYASLAKLADAGNKLVAEGVKMVETYRDVANYG
jgi:probable nitrogen fixation protein